MINKHAGVTERLQDGLAPDVFTDDKRLRPEIRTQILKTVKQIEPDTSRVKGVYMLGSLTGYRYTPTSDIDIMIAIEDLVETRSKTHGVKEFNGRHAVGTKRPIGYFLTTWEEETDKRLQTVGFGVYDLLEDNWTNKPEPREEVAPTFAKFWGEFIVADAKAREFKRVVKDYQDAKKELSNMMASRGGREDLFEYYQVERQKKKVNSLFKEALDFVKQVDKDRKIAYSSGWGLGRESKQNIIFKVLQYEEAGEFFKDLLEYKSDKNLKPKE